MTEPVLDTAPRMVEIMDTTLRDGEQTSGVSFMPHEKLMIARKLLEEVSVDRIEVASARVSDGELEAARKICQWASRSGHLDKVEILGFVDREKSLDWIQQAGGKVVNLLAKGSERHCRMQLSKSPQEHLKDIVLVTSKAHSMGLDVNLYLEDWSNGMKDSMEYVFFLMEGLKNEGIHRFMLPDTLGVLSPQTTSRYFETMTERFGGIHFDFHAHNDYDLAASNALSAVLSGARGVHTSVNGLGERAGNAPLSSVQVILKDHYCISTHINEQCLTSVSQLVESYSGIAVSPNKPVVGRSVFTQVAGVHADGDSKSGLYFNSLLPERFGRTREYALGKSSGKANIRKNLEQLGLELTEEDMRKVTDRIIELGDKKELVTPEDLPYIVSDVLKHSSIEEKVLLRSYVVTTAYGLRPMASVRLEVGGEIYEENATGDGQYNAFVRAVRHIYKNRLGRAFPYLQNYSVLIPPGGRTDALVQTSIEWRFGDKTYRTHALDADQTEAAIKATIKLLNIIEPEYEIHNSNETETGGPAR